MTADKFPTPEELEAMFDPYVEPSGTGCVECLASPDGWWFHLRRCAKCGHVGCCDASPAQHARKHAQESGHRIAQTFEPGENWYWDYVAEVDIDGPPLAPPYSRPIDQPAPAPAERVPENWIDLLH